MTVYNTSPEIDTLKLVYMDSQLIKLVRQITNRVIIDRAEWTPYRIQKLQTFLRIVASYDDDDFVISKLCANTMLVKWSSNNAIVLYRLIY